MSSDSILKLDYAKTLHDSVLQQGLGTLLDLWAGHDGTHIN